MEIVIKVAFMKYANIANNEVRKHTGKLCHLEKSEISENLRIGDREVHAICIFCISSPRAHTYCVAIVVCCINVGFIDKYIWSSANSRCSINDF